MRKVRSLFFGLRAQIQKPVHDPPTHIEHRTKNKNTMNFQTIHLFIDSISIPQRNMNHYNQNQQPREEIVDRLHDTLSVLRRERDEIHRANQLAIERLRLLKEERVAAEKNLSTLQSKYNGIVSSNAKDERRGEISKLQSEVERLGREVRVW